VNRLLEVLRLDLSHMRRRPIVWILVLLLAFLTFEMSRGNAQIGSGDVRVGGTKAWLTSEFAVTQLVIMLVAILYSFFLAVAAGMTLIRDRDQNVGALLHSTRLTPGEYVWGKFLAVVLGFLAVLVVHLGLMMLCNHVLPHGENADAIGPFVLLNYLKPALVFGVPMIVFIAGTSFAVGGLTQRAILVFLVPLAMLLFGAFFLWEWSPNWLAPWLNQLLQFVDLSGLRWINETWLEVDRGVNFYNQRPVGLDALVVVQRLACLLIGLGAVAVVHARFEARERATEGGLFRRKKIQAGETLAAATAAVTPVTARLGTALSTLGMRVRAPSFPAAVWDVARVELKELRSSPGLYLFVPMILIQTLGEIVQTTAFDTTVLSTPGNIAVRQMGALTLMICMLILFYTTESLQRERSAGLAPIFLSAPLRSGAILLGKALANVVVATLVLGAALAGSIVILGIQGKVPLSLGPFMLVWGLLLLPTFVLWTTFVTAAFTLTGNRYATYALGLAAMGLTGFYQMRGKMTWLTNWDLWGTTVWSDLSVLELDRAALVVNRVFVLAVASLLAFVAVRWFPRRERDAAQALDIDRPGRLRRLALTLGPWAVAPVVLGIALGLMVHTGRGGAVTKKKERDYWKKNSATWRDAKLPSLEAVDLDLEVDPKTSGVVSRGTYAMVNRSDDTLSQVPLSGGLHWRNVHWTVDGDSAKPEDRAGLWVVTPKRPLAPGDRLRVSWSFEGRFPDGVSKNGGNLSEFVLPGGVVLTGFSGTGMAPLVGYLPDVGVEDDKNKADPRVYPTDWWKKTLPAGLAMFDGWHTTHIRLTSPADLQHNATGMKVSEKVEGGKRITEWRSDAPVRVFNVVMGRWKVKRSGGAAVYYDPRHAYNVDEMLDGLVAARRWFGEWFAPYPYGELRLSEFPGLATYAQAPPTNITFSENIGFLTKSEDKANAAFWIAAHEAAHQWWPLLAMPADGPGGDVLSEGMAHFSAILLTGKARGLEQRMAFCRQIEDHYANNRRKDGERPLVQMDGSLPGERAAIYDRGGWVFWMLFRLMGEKAGLAGLRDYIATYRDSRDHPLIEEFLAVMRRHAPDPAAFDAFTAQWVFGTVVPQYQVTDAKLAREGKGWVATAKVKNVGEGTAPVTLAAARGERFDKKPKTPYWDVRETITLKPGEEKTVEIRGDARPERLVVDPDVELLMLERSKATAKLSE
jgi:ABC-type transport system involved in multi-copper enzyme maturation permease subunit